MQYKTLLVHFDHFLFKQENVQLLANEKLVENIIMYVIDRSQCILLKRLFDKNIGDVRGTTKGQLISEE